VEQSNQVLFVDDQIGLHESDLTRLTTGTSYVLRYASQAVDAITQANEIDVLVLDLEYPGQEREIERKLGLTSPLVGPDAGIAILEHYRKHHQDVGVIIVTQNPSSEAIGRCMRLGVIQYLDKDRKGGLDCFQLAQEIKNAIELVQERRARRIFEDSGDAGEDIVSRSRTMREVLKEAARFAHQNISILLLGESGVGKERLARFIHRFSDRAQKAFISVNVGALQKDLLGSELFGYLKGAFTGANSDREGLFAAADGGTIFLDEIGEASPDVQVNLLRVLQESELRRIGAANGEKIDVRVIAATNANLQELVSSGTFREDLYYRLDKGTLVIPPLRSRPEDIPVLAHYFVSRFCRKSGQPLKELSAEAVEALSSNNWPGNIRELESVIERTVALTPKLTISKEDLSLPVNKPLGKWVSLVDDLAIGVKDGDSTARRFMDDLDLLVYERLYQRVGTHGKVARLWGKDEEAMTAQRQRWAESLAKQIVKGQREEHDVPSFLKDVCEKYVRKLDPDFHGSQLG
jgi:DNA-binding NtrC family response regulator